MSWSQDLIERVGHHHDEFPDLFRNLTNQELRELKDVVFLRFFSHFQWWNTQYGACARRMGAGIYMKYNNICQSLQPKLTRHAPYTSQDNQYLRQKKKCEMGCA